MPSKLTVITKKRRIHCPALLRLPAIIIIMVLQTSMIQPAANAQMLPAKKFTVTIDAGHGGHDTGARGKNSVEKNTALAIALKLGNYIETQMEDVNVFYTRKTDVFLPLHERAQIANRNKSDLFISIHLNAARKGTAPTGTETYVMGFTKSAENLDLVKQENKAILLEKDYQTRYAGFDPTSDESYILFNNVQNNNLTQSLELATSVQDQFRIQGNRKDRGVYQGNLVVLWGCAKPSILVETGFISNPQEEAFLMTENGQDLIANCILLAIQSYKESIDKKVSGLARTNIPNIEPEIRSDVEVGTKKAEVKKADSEVMQRVEPEKKERAVISADTPGGVKPKVAVQPPVSTTLNKDFSGSGSANEYRIQILASVKKLPANSSEFKGLKNVGEFALDGYYKYMSQPVKTYEEALELRRKLGNSFKGAFIVAFRDGVRVPLNTKADQKNK